MNSKLLLCLALVWTSPPSDCATSPSPAKPINSFGGHGAVMGGDGLDDIASHIFGIEAQIVSIRRTSAVLRSITLKLIKPLPTALGWVPYETPGQLITIRFDESLPKSARVQLKTGDIIRIDFGFINFSGENGSNFSWVSVKNDGGWLNLRPRPSW